MKCSNNIKMTRGDSRAFRFQRLDFEGEPITEVPDTLYFTVKRNFNTKDYLFQKKLDDFTYDEENKVWKFIIEPTDTEDLPYGLYVYDIQVVQNDFKTTIAKGDFRLTDEATFIGNEG